MMTESEAAELIAILKSAYPRQHIDAGTMSIYALMLRDLDRAEVREVVIAYISNEPFFPTIADIRKRVIGARLGLPDRDQAWKEVIDQIHRIGAYGVPVFSCPAIAEAVEAMGWQNLCRSTNIAVERAQFRDLYNGVHQRHVRTANVARLLVGTSKAKLLEGE
jgi:hypothetical protein